TLARRRREDDVCSQRVEPRRQLIRSILRGSDDDRELLGALSRGGHGDPRIPASPRPVDGRSGIWTRAKFRMSDGASGRTRARRSRARVQALAPKWPGSGQLARARERRRAVAHPLQCPGRHAIAPAAPPSLLARLPAKEPRYVSPTPSKPSVADLAIPV